VHRKNLETNAGGFPPPGFDTGGEVVPLTEAAPTLELLFQFIYPKRHPDLEFTEFEVLSPLAEAAEKYEVYSAINICKIRMRCFVSSFLQCPVLTSNLCVHRALLTQHTLEVMIYAAKHGYHDIVGEAAPLLLYTPLDEILVKLPQHLVVPWVSEHVCLISNFHSSFPGVLRRKLVQGPP
jgi:hypothetical protein